LLCPDLCIFESREGTINDQGEGEVTGLKHKADWNLHLPHEHHISAEARTTIHDYITDVSSRPCAFLLPVAKHTDTELLKRILHPNE